MTFSKITIDSLHATYRDGGSCLEVIESSFERISIISDPGIFITLIEKDSIVAEVNALGDFDPISKPLWGVPFAIKDNIDAASIPTTAGCPEFSYIPDTDASVVTRLREAGAILIGKTNLDQFATGLVGTRSPYPPPKNALDPLLIPGGSSSGSAVAVAQGIVTFALGTDTAGSGRVPAALNGIFGLKPSFGVISTKGIVPACKTLDCVSIFSHSISDAKRIFNVARLFDKNDPYSRHWPGFNSCANDPLRVGIPESSDLIFFGDSSNEKSYKDFVGNLIDRGVHIKEIPFQNFYEVANLLYEGPWVAERYAAIQSFIETKREALHPVTRSIIENAKNYSAVDTFQAMYRLKDLKSKVDALMMDIDFLCVPTIPTSYTVDQNLAAPIETNTRLGTYTNFVNLLGLCALVIPTGSQPNGRASSVTMIAEDGKEHLLCDSAEQLTKPKNLSSISVCETKDYSPDIKDVEIAVVGAHLSGLPLNSDLKDLGAIFKRSVLTEKSYKLFELSGSLPPKPGLLRVAEGTGNAIEAEVWALSFEAFGRFITTIPSPLGIGVIRFDDGSEIQGFLVENEAVINARDISEYGGWRNFNNKD